MSDAEVTTIQTLYARTHVCVVSDCDFMDEEDETGDREAE